MRSPSIFPIRSLVLLGSFSLVLSGCLGCSKKKSSGVSLSDQAAVREQADSKSKYVTSLSLAEQVEWLGDSVVDPQNPKRSYLKVRMTDGKEGWVNAWQLAAPAQAAVLLEKTALFKRPDQATASGKFIAAGELVANVNAKEGDWVELVTMNRTQRGWTLRPGFSTDPQDLLAATILRKARQLKDPAKRSAALLALQSNASVTSSRVYEAIKDSLSLPAVPEPVAPAPDTAVPPQ